MCDHLPTYLLVSLLFFYTTRGLRLNEQSNNSSSTSLKGNQPDCNLMNQNVRKEITELKKEIDELTQKVLSLEKSQNHHDTSLQIIQRNFSNFQNIAISLNRTVANIAIDLSTKVAFSAGATSVSSTWNKGVLIFPRVISNAGGGYNPSTGVFTAPTTGHYAFFANVQSYGSSSIFADIVLNGLSKVRTVASSNGNESYEAGPNMVVLALQRGDRVWVRRHSGAGYVSHQDAPVTTFSGFLI